MERDSKDKQLDLLLKNVVAASAADEVTIDEVAASPSVWWAVQREIRQQSATNSPFANLRSWLLIGIPAAAAVVLLIVLFVARPPVEPSVDQVGTVPFDNAENIANIVENTTLERPISGLKKVANRSGRPVPVRHKPSVKKKPAVASLTAATAKKEIRSEFIALSYARDAESGQIVRVKVPRSMMVTVGLVASVDRPTTLVDAEVVLGDDGLTRAIRFIH